MRSVMVLFDPEVSACPECLSAVLGQHRVAIVRLPHVPPCVIV